jgi:hypothetical protein
MAEIDTTITSTEKGLAIKAPTKFDGTRSKFEDFWESIEITLLHSKHAKATDTDKIAFVMSYLTKGAAITWRRSFYLTKKATAMTSKKELDLGTFKDFAKSLENTFKSENAEKEALYKLDTLHQGTRDAEDHVAQFQALVVRAGLKEEKDIICKFEKSLAQHVRARLTHFETIKDLEDWYAKAGYQM